MRLIAVIGKGLDCPRSVCDLAHDVGVLLADHGFAVVTGGLGGVMAAAAEGAWRRGATVLSLIPAGRDDAHPYCTLALTTGLTEPYRNVLLGNVAHGAVMLPGSHGTVQEAMVLIDRDVPVVAVGDHRGWRSAGFNGVPYCPHPYEAVDWLRRVVPSGRGSGVPSWCDWVAQDAANGVSGV